jgi:hypothetical protein
MPAVDGNAAPQMYARAPWSSTVPLAENGAITPLLGREILPEQARDSHTRECRVMNVAGPGFSPFGMFFVVIMIIIAIATWVILAASRFTQGGIVERPERVPQLYGYTVCLIALVMSIICITGIVGGAFDLTTPAISADSEMGFEPSVSSFEAYRATYDQERRFRSTGNGAVAPDSTPESVLRERYSALRADRVARAQARAHKTILTDALGLLLAIALFIPHWRWVRRLGGASGALSVA